MGGRGMKRGNACPKCGSTDIIMVPGKAGAYGVGNNIQVGWTNLSAVSVKRRRKADHHTGQKG